MTLQNDRVSVYCHFYHEPTKAYPLKLLSSPIGMLTIAALMRSLLRIWFRTRSGFAPALFAENFKPDLLYGTQCNLPVHLVDEREPRYVVAAHLTIHCDRLRL